MLYYLRLWRRFYIMAFVRALEYRLNFFVSVGEGVLQLALAAISLMLLYRFTPEVNGWSQAEALLLAGIFRIVESLIALQFTPNITAIDGYVRRGDLDFVLLRPVGSQFLVSLRWVWPAELVNALAGLVLALVAGAMAGAQWSVGGVALAILFGLCGVLALYSLWFITATLSFWLQSVSLEGLFYGVFDAARYPVSFFRGLARTLLTFAFPVAFATTFPAEALLGRANPWLLAVGFVLASGLLLISHFFWNYALRHYGSASS